MTVKQNKYISYLLRAGLTLICCFCLVTLIGMSVDAKEKEDTILDGIYVEDIDLSGLTSDEARTLVLEYVDSLTSKVVTFGAVDDHYVAITAGDLGLTWKNEDVVAKVNRVGKGGNVVKRYKSIQDLKNGNKVFSIVLDFDKELITDVLTQQCAEYDVPAINTALQKTENGFSVIDGKTGFSVDIDASLEKIYTYLTTDWDHKDASIDLVIVETQPKGSREELAKVKDVLGTFSTDYSKSTAARCKNVENGCRRINGITLYPGEEFSACNTMKPFTEANGYFPAGAYLNGKVIESIGGGICQVSTTLYNALLLAELEVVQRNSHSMIVDYVKPSMDAAIAENGGKDLIIKNNYDYPIYIEGYTANKQVTFVVYGVENRESTHHVRFESEVLTVTDPVGEKISTDGSQPLGYVDIQKAHTGYTAQLWKIVEEDGKEVSREVINKSTYQASPRTATVGTITDNPIYAQRLQNAIATGSIDAVKAEVGAIKAEQAAILQMVQEQQNGQQ